MVYFLFIVTLAELVMMAIVGLGFKLIVYGIRTLSDLL